MDTTQTKANIEEKIPLGFYNEMSHSSVCPLQVLSPLGFVLSRVQPFQGLSPSSLCPPLGFVALQDLSSLAFVLSRVCKLYGLSPLGSNLSRVCRPLAFVPLQGLSRSRVFPLQPLSSLGFVTLYGLSPQGFVSLRFVSLGFVPSRVCRSTLRCNLNAIYMHSQNKGYFYPTFSGRVGGVGWGGWRSRR